MKSFDSLSRVERDEIEILLKKGYSGRSIASVLSRSPNTISYEIRVNGGRECYNAKNAHQYAVNRRKCTRHEWKKIEQNPLLKAFIVEKLGLHWNPDEIAGYMKREHLKLCASKTAIYEWLRSVYGQQYCVYLYSKRYRVKKRKSKTGKEMIPNRVSLSNRPLGATNRTRFGHCEVDTVVGKKGSKGGVSVLQERKSRLYQAQKVSTMSSKEHQLVHQQMAERVSARSITGDNGIENKDHQVLGIPTYFCDPYCSWQKGGVEHGNKMFRRYFPKGTDFGEVLQEQIDRAVFLINSKPRKILKYRSALEVAVSAGIITRESVLIEG